MHLSTNNAVESRLFGNHYRAYRHCMNRSKIDEWSYQQPDGGLVLYITRIHARCAMWCFLVIQCQCMCSCPSELQYKYFPISEKQPWRILINLSHRYAMTHDINATNGDALKSFAYLISYAGVRKSHGPPKMIYGDIFWWSNDFAHSNNQMVYHIKWNRHSNIS